MKTKILLMILLAPFIWQGCGKKVVKANIAEWDQFQDPYFKVTFTYPKGWFVVNEPGKISIYSSQEASQKFFDPTSSNPAGVRIVIAQERDTLNSTLEQYVKDFKNDRIQSGFDIKATEEKSIEGLPATQLSYAGFYDKETKLSAIRAMAWKDTSFYTLTYEAFNDLYEPYKLVFDSAMGSLTLPKPKEKSKNPLDEVIPTKVTKVIKNDALEMTVPENMNETYPKVTGEVMFNMSLLIYRKDCTIDIDVRPAKKLTLEKVVEQNSKKIMNVKGKGTATISGEKAQYFNYSLAKDVKSRIYFVVKNDKIYRVIMNYYVPMEKDFLPAFEKVIASIRIK
jgi:hypothetical protein